MIRAKDIIESVKNLVINERNVINTDEIDDFVVKISQQNHVRDKQIHQWLQTTLRKYLINDYPSVGQATNGFIKSRSEYQAPWVDQALARGEKLYKVYLGGGLPQTIEHVIDYLTQAMEPPEDFPQDLKIRDLTRLSVQDAIRKSNDWTEWLNSRDIRGDVAAGEKEIVKLDGGYRVVQLTSAAALDLEGKLMQHCVGSYAQEVQQEDTSIYSLRDSSNKPHVTFEIEPGNKSVEQIKGKQNEPPVEKYYAACIEFLNYGIKKGFIKYIDYVELQDSLESVFHKGKIYPYHEAPDDYHATQELIQMYMHDGRPQYEDVEAVLKRGADPNVKTQYWDNPLVVELKHHDDDILELLLSHGANPKPLIIALDPFVTTKVSLKTFTLIKKYMDPSDWKEICQTSIGADMLVSAMRTNRFDLLEFFLKNGIDSNQEDMIGNTPLKFAIIQFFRKDFGPIEMLLDAGADPDYRGRDKNSAYDMVVGHDNSKLLSLLDKYRGNLDNSFSRRFR
jgi:hypothetical protein